ncbi:MAG TPA: phosphoglycolate phosphatase, partial [Rhodospirillales bacterium]|nr:phosphoglycolate phosphatase [Rhodospirillales bacterium]
MTPESMFFKAIIFDLDGTLIDSAPQVLASVNKVLAGHGHRSLSNDEIIPLLGRGARYT